jgi:hypothetical protein
VWYYLTTSNEKHSQLIRRFRRDGMRFPVVVHYPAAKGTWDERALLLLGGKAEGQAAFLRVFRNYWAEQGVK